MSDTSAYPYLFAAQLAAKQLREALGRAGETYGDQDRDDREAVIYMLWKNADVACGVLARLIAADKNGVFNVRDYGADRTGSKDSTAAIQAAAGDAAAWLAAQQGGTDGD